MIAENALRHQMILPEQQAIFDYWRSKCRQGRLPSRHDIDPSELGEFLPTISLMEPIKTDSGTRYKFRLAGTELYNVYNCEVTGSCLESLPTGSRREYWNRVLNRVSDNGRPSAGAVRSNISGKTHMAQFWIRLPLSRDGSEVSMILGFDKFVRLSEMSQERSENLRIPA